MNLLKRLLIDVGKSMPKIIAMCCFIVGCSSDEIPGTEGISTALIAGSATKNLIIVVIDGPRFTETWGDFDKQYIPELANKLAPQGVVYNNFYNQGVTNTIPGHAAVTTGVYQDLDNSGGEYPESPSIFQLYLSQTKKAPSKAYIVTGKTKLNILADCTQPEWRGKYNPKIDAIDRSDLETFERAKDILRNHQPQLVLVHFKGPDKYGHMNDWNGYVRSIQETDSLLNKLWEFVEQDPHYKGKTTLFLTNDHGRHSEKIATGIKGHGDDCEGCRHINFFAIGPTIKKGVVINRRRHQIDLPATAAAFMKITVPATSGEVMEEIFESEIN